MFRQMHLRIILLCFVLLVSAVSGQLDEAEKKIDETSKNLQESVDKARGFTQADYWENIGLQWKEFLLRNKFVSSANAFFTKINIVFVILFGMNWSLSFNMLFAFLFWIVILYCIYRYTSTISDGWLSFLYSFIALVLLAQINLFEYVGKWSVALVFYKSAFLWKVAFFLGVLVLFVIFGILNKSLSNWFKKRKESKEENIEKEDKKTFGQWVYALTGGDWRKRK